MLFNFQCWYSISDNLQDAPTSSHIIILSSLSHFLLTFNSSVNFAIYCIKVNYSWNLKCRKMSAKNLHDKIWNLLLMITNHFDNEMRKLSNVTMMPIEYWISARIFRIRSSVACSSLWPHSGCLSQRLLPMAWRWRPWWRTLLPWGRRVRPGSRDKLRFSHFKQSNI